MNTPICVSLFLFACMACTNNSFAGNDLASPTQFITTSFKASVKTFDAMNAGTGGTKVCACQILNLRSNNYHLDNVAVFAERTNNDAQTDFAMAMRRLEKEKRFLKIAFFSRINVVAQTRAATDCSTLYKQLKQQHAQLVSYEVLNADVMVR